MHSNEMSFKRKVALITGSTRGIGLAIAKQLLTQGAFVVVNGTSLERVKETVTQLEIHAEGRVIGVAGRVEEMKTGQLLVETAIQAFGRVDFLINNAGIVADRMTHRMSEEEWDQVMRVHAKGTFSCTQPFIQALRESAQPGIIINMISTAGLLGTVGQINYAAAKGAILAMTYTWAEELKSLPVRVHAVAPAALTDMTRPHVNREQKLAREQGKELPEYWRIGSAEEVGRFVSWLLSHSVESGTVFGINGTQAVQWLKPVCVEYPFDDIQQSP
ncbi:SDR family NAD(P)-dependent oxidoreductase [Brevibacillus ginsengisoli]|uniref:SDR family NAD(P)-dependent oxidoreductase n=1 Tax=Brevibacillus ginsengisoli TaxID=363854 RepID=UPI003CEEFB76